ncbi:hypothetical protein D9M71_99260 [compost metagenome]
MVVTGADGADQFQPWAGCQYRAVNSPIERRDQGIVDVLEQFGEVGRCVRVRHAHIAQGAQALKQRRRKLA